MKAQPFFHLAFPVIDLEATRDFFTRILGCDVGRADGRWIDFNFFGHQITAHLTETMPTVATNEVDGRSVPVSHFGLVLEWEQWERLADRLRELGVAFLIPPHVRFRGQVGEQATLFILDPSGNGIELKSFKDPSRLFQP
jgi:extradiol dioxygenase family protein